MVNETFHLWSSGEDCDPTQHDTNICKCPEVSLY